MTVAREEKAIQMGIRTWTLIFPSGYLQTSWATKRIAKTEVNLKHSKGFSSWSSCWWSRQTARYRAYHGQLQIYQSEYQFSTSITGKRTHRWQRSRHQIPCGPQGIFSIYGVEDTQLTVFKFLRANNNHKLMDSAKLKRETILELFKYSTMKGK